MSAVSAAQSANAVYACGSDTPGPGRSTPTTCESEPFSRCTDRAARIGDRRPGGRGATAPARRRSGRRIRRSPGGNRRAAGNALRRRAFRRVRRGTDAAGVARFHRSGSRVGDPGRRGQYNGERDMRGFIVRSAAQARAGSVAVLAGRLTRRDRTRRRSGGSERRRRLTRRRPCRAPAAPAPCVLITAVAQTIRITPAQGAGPQPPRVPGRTSRASRTGADTLPDKLSSIASGEPVRSSVGGCSASRDWRQAGGGAAHDREVRMGLVAADGADEVAGPWFP